jgi:protease-4
MLGSVANDDRVQILIDDLATADSVNSGQMLAVGPRLREQ